MCHAQAKKNCGLILLQIAMVNPVTYTEPWKIASPDRSNKQWFY